MIISLFPKTDVCHLVDIPTLVEHYQEHQTQKEISFWQFITMHYTHSEHQKEEPSKHKHLPLQHHHVECCSILVLEAKTFNLYWINKQSVEKIIVFANTQDLYYFQPLKGIFQPPKNS
jgi:hypothetical protein